MKVTTLSFEFDGRNEQEVTNVTKMLKELLSGVSDDVSVETNVVASKKEEKPVGGSKITSTAVPAFGKPVHPVPPTFSEPTKTAAPVQEVKEEPKQGTITEAIAEVKKEMEKPENVAKPKPENVAKPKPENVAKPKTVKEAPQATIEPEPVQAPSEEEKAPEEAPNEHLTAKDMQAFMIDLMKTGKITRPQLTDIMLEFGGASLMRIKPEKYELLKQRIETYND